MDNSQQRKWNQAYQTGQCAWDTRVPSPELLSFLKQRQLSPSRVLDIGCGTGANAIFLARQGHSVLAIDFVEGVIKKAKQAALDLGPQIEFLAADFLELSGFTEQFSFVFDSGVYHSTRTYALKRYMETIWRVMKPGGLFLSLVGNAEDSQIWGPARVTAFELLAEHQPYFELLELKQFYFDSTIDNSRPLGWSALLRRRSIPLTLTAMMSHLDICESYDEKSYKENSLIYRVEALINKIAVTETFPWKMKISARNRADCADLLVEYVAPDRTTGKVRTVRYERTAAFRASLSDQELLHTIVTNLAVIAVHELLEHFMIDNKRVFDPHTVARLLDTRYAELAMLTPTGVTNRGPMPTRKIS